MSWPKQGWPLSRMLFWLNRRQAQAYQEVKLENRELKARIGAATEKLMENQRGESGLPFEPAEKVVRPALEILDPPRR